MNCFYSISYSFYYSDYNSEDFHLDLLHLAQYSSSAHQAIRSDFYRGYQMKWRLEYIK